MSLGNEIHDMIMQAHTEPTAETIHLILNILDKLNDKIDRIEGVSNKTANIASCLANGVQPD
jgi:hypothetical protein